MMPCRRLSDLIYAHEKPFDKRFCLSYLKNCFRVVFECGRGHYFGRRSHWRAPMEIVDETVRLICNLFWHALRSKSAWALPLHSDSLMFALVSVVCHHLGLAFCFWNKSKDESSLNYFILFSIAWLKKTWTVWYRFNWALASFLSSLTFTMCE